MAVAVILSLLYNYTSNVGIQDFIIYQERNGLCQLSGIFNFNRQLKTVLSHGNICIRNDVHIMQRTADRTSR